MTISTVLNRIAYTGNGVTSAFSFPYAFFSTSDLVVVETIVATGVQTVKTLTTHYTVTGTKDALNHYPNGGTVNAVLIPSSVPASTVTWTIYRDPAATQTTDFVENDSLPAESLEAAIDYQAMLNQRTRDIAARCLQQPEGDSATISRLPALVVRANKYLAFDSSGNPEAVDAATASGTSVLATGSTTARLLADRAADWVNVKDYGAIGNGVADDTAAIQAAINALDTGTTIKGKIVFPAGSYLVSSVLTIGDGVKSVSLELAGIDIVYGSYIPNGPVRIVTASAANHLFTINMGTNSSGFYMHGFTLEHPAAATGRALNFATAANFVRLESIACYNSGIGVYYVLGTVSPVHRNVCFFDCTSAGLRLGVIMTDGLFDACYFQQGNANGVVIDTSASLAATFNKCTFQGNTSHDFLLNGSMEVCHFFGCWQEASYGNFIQIVGAKLLAVDFHGCHFSGAASAGPFWVIYNAAAAASGIYGQDLLFSGCDFANLTAGGILGIATDPSGSSQPGYLRVTIVQPYSVVTGELFQGMHTQSQPSNALTLINTPWTAANVRTNATYSEKPRTLMLGGGSDKWTTFTDLDTTPSVATGYHFVVTNSGATVITMFDDGYPGQEITLIFTDGNTTLTDGGSLLLAGGFVSSANDTMRLIFRGTAWYELSRSVN